MADFDISIGTDLVTIDLPGEIEISIGYQSRKKDQSDARLAMWFGEREHDGAQGVRDITDSALGQMGDYGTQMSGPIPSHSKSLRTAQRGYAARCTPIAWCAIACSAQRPVQGTCGHRVQSPNAHRTTYRKRRRLELACGVSPWPFLIDSNRCDCRSIRAANQVARADFSRRVCGIVALFLHK
jgi:hypothetical protein